MKIRLALKSGLLASLLCVGAYSQTYKPFPGESVDQKTRNIQERVEDIYVSGDYQRALLIYEKELAPLGDKYAQYMVGYMYINAQGVPKNNVTGLAWYRLAAERGEPLLQRVRDQLIAQLSPVALEQSDQLFLNLWKKIGDQVLIMDLIRDDMRSLRARTGTRIPMATTSGPAVIYRPNGVPFGPNYYRDIRHRLDARINYLKTRVEVSDIVLAEELERIRSQGEEVTLELAAMENR